MRSSSEEMLKLVEAYKSSGQSQKLFCEENGLKKSTFSYWVKKENQESPPSKSKFIKVSPPQVMAQTHLHEIYFPNGVKFKTSQSDLSFLGALIKSY